MHGLPGEGGIGEQKGRGDMDLEAHSTGELSQKLAVESECLRVMSGGVNAPWCPAALHATAQVAGGGIAAVEPSLRMVAACRAEDSGTTPAPYCANVDASGSVWLQLLLPLQLCGELGTGEPRPLPAPPARAPASTAQSAQHLESDRAT